ncbi:hypothetical protein PENTCL1PPCAC_10026 [Pristionchus entomophagus]|uniref:Uncharacterized protein n=1 Tax=Pristionchus entomophagus TaxID=358040 RepID=A0AAV5SWZ0_9BILA|nr:hypothetical protein PENTCL1PPCAC_10026 [Pristionchus entomophagus]
MRLLLFLLLSGTVSSSLMGRIEYAVESTVQMASRLLGLQSVLPLCTKKSIAFPFSEDFQDSFALEAGERLSLIRFSEFSEVKKVIKDRAPHTDASFVPLNDKFITNTMKELDNESRIFFEKVLYSSYGLIVHTSNFLEDEVKYNIVVDRVWQEINESYDALSLSSKKAILRLFCVRFNSQHHFYLPQFVRVYRNDV